MAFFNQMGMGGGGMGMGGSPSAFTSPGMDPMTLQLLLRMQQPGGANAPQIPTPPTGPMAGPNMMPQAGGAGQGAGPQQLNLLSLLSQASQFNPNNMKNLLGMLGLGGGGGGGAGSPLSLLGLGSPGSGTGGLY